jgi:hypothetical protein
MECRGNVVTNYKCATEGCMKAAEKERADGLCVRCARSAPGLPAGRSGASTSSTSGAGFSATELGDLSPRRSESETETPPALEKSTVTIQPLESAKIKSELLPTRKTRSAPSPATESAGKTSTLTSEARPTYDAQETQNEIKIVMPSSDDGTGKSELSALAESMRPATAVVRPETSTAPLLSAEEEKLASLSLVDECLERLNLQMRRLTIRQAGPAPLDPIGASHSERQRASLAINTAREISRMVRLKVDAVKAFRGK